MASIIGQFLQLEYQLGALLSIYPLSEPIAREVAGNTTFQVFGRQQDGSEMVLLNQFLDLGRNTSSLESHLRNNNNEH